MANKPADSVRSYQPFRYPGSKTKLASNPAFMALIDELLVDTEVFYEGFLGSAAVTLGVALRYPNMTLVGVDRDHTISGFWELIANGTDEQAKELEDLILGFAAMKAVRSNKKAFRLKADPKRKPSDPDYEEPKLDKVEYFRKLRARGEAAANGTETPLSLVERAYHALFFNRTTFSGIAMSQPIGGFYQSSEWTIDCRYNAKLLVEKVRNLRRLLQGRLTVFNKDIWDWLTQDVPENVPMYLDPPYYMKGEVLYPVAMENFEHARLANTLAARTNWIMSYDICPEVTTLYENQKLLEIPFRYSINGKKNNWNHQQEYLICSPEIDTSGFEVELVKWKAEVKARAELKVSAAATEAL